MNNLLPEMFATGELAIAWYAQSIVNTADDRLQTMSGDEINQVHELSTAAEQHAPQFAR